MKQAEYIKRSLLGERLIIVEFRKTEADEIRRKVVKQGESSTMPMAKHTVLVDSQSFEHAEFLPDGAKLDAVKALYPPRTLVVYKVEGLHRDEYRSQIKGSFEGRLEE